MDSIVANKYRVVRVLGAGGTGVVLEAEHLTLAGRRVALKHLHPQFRDDPTLIERFVREAQIAAALEHPGIVAVLDVERDAVLGPVVVMERLEGCALEELLRAGPLAPERAAWLMAQALDAVGYAHARGVVHRDLKPGNLFVVGAGAAAQVKVLDFGIARPSAGRELTEPGMFLGTPRYASPEQRDDAAAATARSDLYSLGVTLLEMLTGHKPAPHDLGAVRAGRFDLAQADAVPESLRAALRIALAERPEERFGSAAEMRAALTRALLPEGQTAPTVLAARAREPDAPTRRDAAPQPPARDVPSTARARAPSAEDRAETTLAAVARGGSRRSSVPRSRASLLATATALLAVGGAVAALVHGRAPRRAPAASAAVDPVALDANDRATLTRACQEWSGALLAHQDAAGSFSAELGGDPNGWETAQHLAGLAFARETCSAVEIAPLERAIHALDALELPAGWTIPPSPNAYTPANAWAVVAFARLADATDDPGLRARALATRALVLAAQNADGGFTYVAEHPAGAPSNPYSSVLATWALLESEPLDASADAIAARRRALAWLRATLARADGEPPVRTVPGLAEQALWVLWRAHATVGDVDPRDGALARTYARDFLARCQLTPGPRPACARPFFADGRAVVAGDPGPGNAGVVTVWFPWAVSASAALARDPAAPLEPEDRAGLAALARSVPGVIAGGADMLTVARGYRLIEFEIALTELLRR